MLNDFQIAPTGQFLFIADASVIRGSPVPSNQIAHVYLFCVHVVDMLMFLSIFKKPKK
jgi:hypothetical protein